MISSGRKKPFLLKIRASKLYISATIAFGLFVDMMIYSIIVPIMPFVIDAIHQGKSPEDSSGSSPYNSTEGGGGGVSGDIGILLALFAAGLIAGSPIFGYLGDKMLHRQVPMLFGMATLLGSVFLFLYGTKFWMLILARLLQGLSDACIWTLGLCIIKDTYPLGELGTQMSRVVVFHTVGMVAGAPVGALYQYYGYRAPFYFCIAITALDFLLRLILVERRNQPPEWFESSEPEKFESRTEPARVEDGTRSDASTVRDSSVDDLSVTDPEKSQKADVNILRLLTQPRVLAAALIAFAHGVAFNVFEPTMTVHLATEWNFESSMIGLVFLAQVMPAFIATPLYGWLYDRYGGKVLCSVTALACATATILMGIPRHDTAGGVAPLIVLFAIQGFFAYGLIVPCSPEMAHAVDKMNNGGDEGSARIYAMLNIGFAGGALVGPLAGGYIYDSIGFFWLCVIVACFLYASAPIAYCFMGDKISMFALGRLFKRKGRQ